MNKNSSREFWGSMKHNNIHIIGTPEEEGSEQGIENLFEEIMTENFPNLGKEKVIQGLEVLRAPIKMNPKRPIPRHKERILKEAREKQSVTYKGVPRRLSA